jgi:cell division septum initiation protein DivIVA
MSDLAPTLHAPAYWCPKADGEDLLAMLEERMSALIERHHDALKRIEELSAQLRERDDQLVVLGRRIEQRDRTHAAAAERLDQLIDRVRACEVAGTGAAASAPVASAGEARSARSDGRARLARGT